MKRREFLARAGSAGMPLQALALEQAAPRYTGKPALKITDIQPFLFGMGRN